MAGSTTPSPRRQERSTTSQDVTAKAKAGRPGQAKTHPARPAPQVSRNPKRRGRPRGSVSLTADIQRQIVSAILAGCFDHVAAESAGISARTFREWMARGEGRHPTKSCTPRLKTFAKAVRLAQNQARAAREVEVARSDPKLWLRILGRSRPDREGWTEPVYPDEVPESQARPPHTQTPEKTAAVLRILVEAGVFSAPDCTVSVCACTCHPRRNER